MELVEVPHIEKHHTIPATNIRNLTNTIEKEKKRKKTLANQIQTFI